MVDEEETYAAQAKSGEEEEIDFPFPFLNNWCDESKKNKSKDSDSDALGDYIPSGVKSDLLPESEVNLGQGNITDSDYPGSFYEESYKESLERYEAGGEPPPSPPFRSPMEEALYRHVLRKSDYFEVPWIPYRSSIYGQFFFVPYDDLRAPLYEKYVNYCKQAIDEYNKKEGTRYVFKYLIKICTDMLEYNITLALTDPEYHPYVARVKVHFPCYPPVDNPVIHPMKVTRGEYRVPDWTDAEGNEFKCETNEELRQKLPELEKEWKHKMNLD